MISELLIRTIFFILIFRKTGLFLNNIPAVIGSVLMVTSKFIASFEVFIVGRILIGFSAG